MTRRKPIRWVPFAVLLGALVACATVSRAPRAAAGVSPAVTGPLHTSGNGIYDARNQRVLLRGVNSDWLSTNTFVVDDTPLGDDSIGAMRAWGATIVRVALGEQFWNADECQHSPSYPSTVDQVVRSITSRGMVALLELDSNTRQPCLPAGPQRMADYPGSVYFWKSLALRYRSNPLVAFDLYNEPHDITWSQWLDGGTTLDTDGVLWTMAGMQQMYDAVRSTGAQNLVVVSGNDWASNPPPPGVTVAGHDIVYAAHSYSPVCPSDALPLYCALQSPTDPTAANAALPRWDTFLTANPVLVSEFGWPNPGSGTYNQGVIGWAQSHGVGWMAFDWGVGHAGTRAEYGLLSTMAPTYSPDQAGDPVRQSLGG